MCAQTFHQCARLATPKIRKFNTNTPDKPSFAEFHEHYLSIPGLPTTTTTECCNQKNRKHDPVKNYQKRIGTGERNCLLTKKSYKQKLL